jgi:TrmH family RNA methyltransferase
MEWTSRTSAHVKRWARLCTAKGREEERAYIVEGEHIVHEAHVAQARVTDVWVLRGYRGSVCAWQGKTAAVWHTVTEEVMDKITDAQSVPPVAARVQMEEEVELLAGMQTVVALDAVQDPGNVGTIIRTAAAFGTDMVLLGHGCADVYHPKTLRAAQGAHFFVPVWRGDIVEALTLLRQDGVAIAATAVDGAPLDASYGRTCWVLGNEGAGISSASAALCTHRVRIPMRREIQSLNVAVASAIVLYASMGQ